jgi:hypothetical protein
MNMLVLVAQNGLNLQTSKQTKQASKQARAQLSSYPEDTILKRNIT